MFQRSSSNVEGRNSTSRSGTINYEASTTPQRTCLTAVHNFFLTRPDGTTAAERFSGRNPGRCLPLYSNQSRYPLRLSVRRNTPSTRLKRCRVADAVIEAQHVAMQAARQRQETAEFKAQYALSAGVESSLS